STLTSGPVGGILVGSPNVRGLTLDPATNELFLVNLANSTLAVVNGSTGHEVGGAISGIPGLISVAYDSADEEVYALGRSVSIVDPLSHAIVGGPIGIAPHVVAWAIVYDPSREFLYVTSNDSLLPPWPGNVSAFDGSSVAASEDGSYVSIPVGQLPVDLQPVQLPGSAAPGSGEIFVTNLLSGTLSVIASAPAITFLAATPNPVDTGVRSTILLGYTGGAGPSMLSYTGLPAGCASADSTALLCTPTSAGSYAVIANVVDSLGVSASTSTVLSVAPALTVAAVLDTTSTGELDLGDALSASATVTGGSGPFNYSWEFGDGTGGYGADLAHSYAAVGVYYVTITVTDSGGGVSSTTATVSVVPLPSVSVSASPTNETDVGISLGFAVTVSGGTGAGNTSWAFDDGGTAFGASASHRFAVAGVYLVAVHYRDASGANASSFVPVVVNPALSAEYTVRPTPPGASVTTGTTLEFNTSISGGTAPYTIVWGFDDGSYGYGVSSSHSYGQAGTYTVTLFVEDAVGGEWNTTYRLAVASPSSAPTFGSEFEDGLVLGLLVGAVAAAAVLFVAARSKKRPPAPPTAFVPPAARTEVAPPEPWREA
ncbi:MAG: PKD domain-containing protein, partial [Thermoplasmata archaeon]